MVATAEIGIGLIGENAAQEFILHRARPLGCRLELLQLAPDGRRNDLAKDVAQ